MIKPLISLTLIDTLSLCFAYILLVKKVQIIHIEGNQVATSGTHLYA